MYGRLFLDYGLQCKIVISLRHTPKDFLEYLRKCWKLRRFKDGIYFCSLEDKLRYLLEYQKWKWQAKVCLCDKQLYFLTNTEKLFCSCSFRIMYWIVKSLNVKSFDISAESNVKPLEPCCLTQSFLKPTSFFQRQLFCLNINSGLYLLNEARRLELIFVCGVLDQRSEKCVAENWR